MKKKENTNDLKKEIEVLLDKITPLLKENDTISDSALINDIYSITHSINEFAGIYGANSINHIFEPIENGISQIIKAKSALSADNITMLINAVNLTSSVLDDPSLKNSSIKSTYNSLVEKIKQSFSTQQESEESIFANNRFQEIFIEEAFELINQLEEKLLQLEGEPKDLDLIDNVFRIMHTLKGNSNMFGFVHLGEITHHLENIYDAVRDGKLSINKDILNITLQCIDHFRNLIEDPDLEDSSNQEIQVDILQDIKAILSAESENPTKTSSETRKESAKSNSIKTYYIYFSPLPNVFDDGSNPLYFVYDLNDYGTCLPIPVVSGIPANEKYSPEICYTAWHILLATDESKETIQDNFIFLPDKSQPKITVLAKKDLTKDIGFIKKFRLEAVAYKPISDKLIADTINSNITDSEEKRIVRSRGVDPSISSIRVASAKIDLMMNLISELVTKQAELSMLAHESDISQLTEVAESIESISRDLRDNAFSISLIPLEKSVLRFQRLVRDVSSKFNKKVNFVVEGKETELDKTIIEKIVDPIMHILRNSIDHGIETPEQRKKIGKPEEGTIVLKAYPSGAHVIIEISDDGAGINIDKVHSAAVNKGYVTQNEDFSNDEMLKLILSPGFSTAENISEVSGRGVGMDVVYQKITEIRGELDIMTEANMGTTMTIKLPLTISIIDSLLVMIGDTHYLIPLSVVERCAEVNASVITECQVNYLNLNGEYIPFIDLHSEFKIKSNRSEFQRLILVNHKDITVALVVDQILGNYQAVLKSLGQIYRRQEIISGASILGNGEVALVLDTNKLLQEYMTTREDEINKINILNARIEEKVV